MIERNVRTARVGLLITLWALRAGAADDHRDAIPAILEVPPEQVLRLSARGIGVQIYACAADKDDPTRYAWILTSPEAELRDASGRKLGKHYAGPTWEASDGSKVVGDVVARDPGPDDTAIPWLLLRAKGTSGSGIFSSVLSIQRLNTTGGKAPVVGCDQTQSGKEARVPYAADYRFFVARSGLTPALP